MFKAVLSLRSNIGKREENMVEAIHAIELLSDTTVISKSDFYESKAKDPLNEYTNYLNCCILLLTELSPKVLLGACLGVEAAMNSQNNLMQETRMIAIDLLIYENKTSNESDLKLPHPQMLNRSFVLVPLNDIFPEKTALGVDFSEAWERLNCSEVIKY